MILYINLSLFKLLSCLLLLVESRLIHTWYLVVIPGDRSSKIGFWFGHAFGLGHSAEFFASGKQDASKTACSGFTINPAFACG